MRAYKIQDIKDSLFFTQEVGKYVVLLRKISRCTKINLSEKEMIEELFFSETKKLLRKADNFVLEKEVRDQASFVKRYFREILQKWILKGKIVKRGYEKPRGYPGDYKTLEMIYDEKDVANNLIGQLFDKYLLRDSYVTAVRNRKEKIKILIKNSVNNSSGTTLRILNIASGGARDIREFLIENEQNLKNRHIEIDLVDQDIKAISFSKKQMDSIRSSVKINYWNENISNFFRNKDDFRARLGKFDLIYSIGLIDYISDFLLKELIKFCFQLLAHKGELIFAVKNTKIYKSLASDWFCDWKFYLRDEKDLISLVKSALKNKAFKIRLIKGFDNQISFISIKK